MNGVQPSIKVSQLINVLYCVSNNFDEQKQIGEFFINLDNLITLHQRKSDALITTGQAFCQGVFLPYGVTVDDNTEGVRIGGLGSTDKP